MNIAELRNRLADIAAELAEQDVQQVEEGNASGMLRQLGQDPKYFPDAQIDPTENKGVYELLASNGEHVAYILMNDDGGATIALANGDDYDLADEENAETTLQSMYQEINGDSDMEESVEEFAEEDDLDIAEDDVEESKTAQGADGPYYQEMKAKEMAEKDGKDWSRMSYGDKEDYRAKVKAMSEETVELPVAALEELMQLAGYANYADKLAEYENEPEEEYMDAEDQLIGLSGGLNGPKNMHPAAAGGDNPMDQEPRKVEEDAIATVEQTLYKSYKSFLEEAEIEDNA